MSTKPLSLWAARRLLGAQMSLDTFHDPAEAWETIQELPLKDRQHKDAAPLVARIEAALEAAGVGAVPQGQKGAMPLITKREFLEARLRPNAG